MDRTQQKSHCAVALEAAKKAGARYVEVRLVSRESERMDFKNGACEMSTHSRDLGIGVRALTDRGWGYAATNIMGAESLASAARRAVEVGLAVDRKDAGDIQIPEASHIQYATEMARDPFEVDAAEKQSLFAECHRRMLAHDGVKTARGGFVGLRQETTFLASNGSDQHQVVTICGGGVSAIAMKDGEVQVRSTPKSHEGNILQGGFELLEGMDLPRLGDDAAREAVALTRAPIAPSGPTTVILDGSQLSLQIHESVGHPTELDRVLGEEISLAGASFILPQARDNLRYGSEIVNLTADSTSPTGPGTFGFDDEGTPATKVPIVSDGHFVGFLSGRDAARRVGCAPASSLRAEGWARKPIVRMVNVNLEPGSGSRDDLISGVDDGLVLAANKSWSIDDLRLNFQFSCEVAYEIKGGRLTGNLFKNPIYRGVTPEFWSSCSAIAGPEAWQMWGYLFCGKGDPGQIMYVGHGCAPTRFDRVEVRGA